MLGPINLESFLEAPADEMRLEVDCDLVENAFSFCMVGRWSCSPAASLCADRVWGKFRVVLLNHGEVGEVDVGGLSWVVTWSTSAQSELGLRNVTTELTVPWDLVWGPDHHIWCMEKMGRITRIHPDEGTVEEVHQIPGVYQSFDNSGAHAMMLHPDFPTQPYLYVNYTYSEVPWEAGQ